MILKAHFLKIYGSKLEMMLNFGAILGNFFKNFRAILGKIFSQRRSIILPRGGYFTPPPNGYGCTPVTSQGLSVQVQKMYKKTYPYGCKNFKK